jgi:hypothetical protein
MLWMLHGCNIKKRWYRTKKIGIKWNVMEEKYTVVMVCWQMLIQPTII